LPPSHRIVPPLTMASMRSSSVLTAGRPMIATGRLWMSLTSVRYRMGSACSFADPHDPTSTPRDLAVRLKPSHRPTRTKHDSGLGAPTPTCSTAEGRRVATLSQRSKAEGCAEPVREKDLWMHEEND